MVLDAIWGASPTLWGASLPLLAAAVIIGPVRAFAVERLGRREARVIWWPALGAMVLVTLLLLGWWAIADLVRNRFEVGFYQPLFLLGFLTVYLAPAIAAGLVSSCWADRERGVAGAAAGLGVGAYLVLVYPWVNFVNSCFLGQGFLLPAGCN